MKELDFDKYYEAGEPEKRERAYAWATAIGLQDVDGLKPSKYLLETAQRNIEGEITADEAVRLIDEYYEKKDKERRDDGINVGIKEANDVINDVVNGVVKLTAAEEKAVALILRDGHITAARLASALGLKPRQGQRIIASLKSKANLKRRGADKNGEWYFATGKESLPVGGGEK